MIIAPFSGRGEIPHRRYVSGENISLYEARERLLLEGSSRSGAMPEPTVTVRMEEKVQQSVNTGCLSMIALGDVSVT